jgi:hypothetical protein
MVSIDPSSTLSSEVTSDQGNAAFNNIFSFLVEVEAIGPNARVHCSSVEKALHHFQEGGASGEVVSEGQGEEG